MKRAGIVFFLMSLVVRIGVGEAQPVYIENQIPARNVQIRYALRVSNPGNHLFDVSMSITSIRATTVDVALPAWSPGAYSIRDYARNVQDFRATSATGKALSWEKVDKHTWRVRKEPDEQIELRYQVFSRDLTDVMAEVASPAVFMYVVNHKHVPVSLRYEVPSDWTVYTGLEEKEGAYSAPDYDVFVDAPAFLGKMKVLEFTTAAGVRHRLVFSKPDVALTENQVLQDIQDIVETGTRVFGKAPYRDYTFLFKVQPVTGSGGLEHLNSTRITVGENDFTNQTSYQRFLFVVAHEFFHLWNVKRIRPKVLGPFDYTQEVYTKDLWISEGITSYYANLLLARSGILTEQEYLDKISAEVNTFQQQPGRSLMSAEEASWNTWLRSDNSAENSISYYTKGELVGLLLDLEIRSRTKGQKSLDDVMRYLMSTYADKGVGFPEGGFLKAVQTVAGSDFEEFFEMNARSRQELNYNRYLQHAGLTIEVRRQPPDIWVGIEFERAETGSPRIRRTLPDSPARKAGLDAGDVLVAMSGVRLTFENFRTRLHNHRLGEAVSLTVMRGDRMLTLNLVPVERQEQRWHIVENPQAKGEHVELRKAWLSSERK